MKQNLKDGAVIGGAFIAYLVAIVVVVAVCFGLYAFFGPRTRAVDYQVFKQSQQYRDGMARRLADFRSEYNQPGETGAARDNIRSIVRHEFAQYDPSDLNPDLRAFLAQMKGY